jgi:hypothetical protein
VLTTNPKQKGNETAMKPNIKPKPVKEKKGQLFVVSVFLHQMPGHKARYETKIEALRFHTAISRALREVLKHPDVKGKRHKSLDITISKVANG